MRARHLAPGLWRWTAPHPDWRPGAAPGSPGDWERKVGSVLWRDERTAAFMDALVPDPQEAFWSWADPLVEGRRALALTTIRWHRRSRDALVARYGASTSRAAANLPRGLGAIPLRGAGETCFWIEPARALVVGDRLLGDGRGGLRLCPPSWLGYLDSGIGIGELRQRLAPLLELPIERVLVSHGEPVLRGGRRALAAALEAAG